MWLADHGTSGPEVVLAVGVAPSRRWAEQWYGLVVAVAPCPVSVYVKLQKCMRGTHMFMLPLINCMSRRGRHFRRQERKGVSKISSQAFQA